MQRALQGANPKWLIGIDKALIAAKLLRWPGKRISVTPRSPLMQRTLRITTDLKSLMLQGKDADVVPQPQGDAIAALAFTSGSTGPSKGVIYRHRQIQAQRDALMDVYQITPDDKLVAAFAPFALYGPTMCITSTVPDMNVAAPGTLTSTALADAITLLDATLVFASPAALVNVCATADAVQDVQRNAMQKVRLVLSAGAPVRARLMQTASKLFTKADFHTPYGMTEMLPVADISLNQLLQIEKAGSVANEPSAAPRDSFGVCVGYPLPGVEVLIDPLDASGLPTQCPTDSAEIFGEIIVRAEHAREGYDRLWLTTHQASQPPGWHRTGDIGTLDSEGRLWVGGRLAHVITSASGLIAPVSSEQSIETLESIEMAAVVGVGPVGKQAVVAVIQTSNGVVKAGEAPLPLIDEIRSTVSSDIDITSVLITAKLPVDRRHNSKVDRSAVAHWAARVLAGERAPKL